MTTFLAIDQSPQLRMNIKRQSAAHLKEQLFLICNQYELTGSKAPNPCLHPNKPYPPLPSNEEGKISMIINRMSSWRLPAVLDSADPR
jgi:hypothetical protein